MLTKQKSRAILKLKYALLIPIVFGMLLYTSCETETVKTTETELSISEQVEQLKTTIQSKKEITKEEQNAITNLLKEIYKQKLNNIAISLDKAENTSQTEVPFSVIDQIPVFPGCESLPTAQQRKCMSEKISTFVAQNFNTKLADNLNLKGMQKIYVLFKIDTNGQIIEARARAPHPDLETEAIRVINMLPQMIPGMHRGKTVVVPYTLPIKFKIKD